MLMNNSKQKIVCTLTENNADIAERVARAFRVYLQSREAKGNGAIPMQGSTVYPPVAGG